MEVECIPKAVVYWLCFGSFVVGCVAAGFGAFAGMKEALRAKGIDP